MTHYNTRARDLCIVIASSFATFHQVDQCKLSALLVHHVNSVCEKRSTLLDIGNVLWFETVLYSFVCVTRKKSVSTKRVPVDNKNRVQSVLFIPSWKSDVMEKGLQEKLQKEGLLYKRRRTLA
jgi:hypothetical protein